MAALQACQTKYQANSNISTNRGYLWAWGAEAMTMFNTIVPPSSNTYQFNQCRQGCDGCNNTYASDHSDFSNASSNHPGGCNFAFGDGSVKFVKSTISMPTYWAIGTKAGGEVISSDTY